MDSVYVIGHRNPDTDSVVSAMAYAALNNALGENNYIAARAGHLTGRRCGLRYAALPGCRGAGVLCLEYAP